MPGSVGVENAVERVLGRRRLAGHEARAREGARHHVQVDGLEGGGTVGKQPTIYMRVILMT